MNHNNLALFLNHLKSQGIISTTPYIMPHSRNVQIKCPLHKYRHDPESTSTKKSFSIKIDPSGKSLCMCHTIECKFKGTLKSLIFELSKNNPAINKPYLLNLIDNLETDDMSSLLARLSKPTQTITDVDNTEKFNKFIPIHKDYRGIPHKALLDYNVRLDLKRKRVVVPLIKDNKIVGATGRTYINSDLRWFNYYNFRKEQYLVGQHIPPKKACILCEGSFDAIWLHSVVGDKYNVYSVLGSNLSVPQQQYILNNHDEAIMFFDNDLAGLICTKKTAFMLASIELYGIIYTVLKKDPLELSSKEVEQHIIRKIKYKVH